MENYLEDSEILSEEIITAIDEIIKNTKDVVFGGSIALNAIGLIKRPIKDIDLMIDGSLVKCGLSYYLKQLPNGELSETTTDVNGDMIKRVSAEIKGVKTCVFKLPSVTYSSFTFSGRTIKIQNVNEAILAKRAYSGIDCKSKKKHYDDICGIDEFLNGLI